MLFRSEITYRTPDALFNGQATVNVIQSCVPNIKNAWKMPVVDLNPVLIAIRIATSGHTIEMSSTCPSCTESNDYEIDLRSVLSSMSTVDFSKPISYMDMEIYFVPMTYENQNKINVLQYEQQRAMVSVAQSDANEETKNTMLNKILSDITKVTIEAIKHSIGSIRTPQSIVVEPEYIEEFLNNCDKNLFNKIKDHVVQLRNDNDMKPLKMTCAHCQTQYEQELALDSSNFFD